MLLQMEYLIIGQWLSSVPACVCTQNIFFLHSSAHRHLGHSRGLHSQAVLPSAVAASSFLTVSVFSQNMCPGVGLLDQVVVLFSHFLRNFQTVFHNGCTYVHSNQQGTRVFFLSTSSPTFVTVEGMLIKERSSQPSNALAPIDSSPSGPINSVGVSPIGN